MKKVSPFKITLALLSAALLPILAPAQDAGGKSTLAISSIKPTSSLEASVKPDKKLEMGRILE